MEHELDKNPTPQQVERYLAIRNEILPKIKQLLNGELAQLKDHWDSTEDLPLYFNYENGEFVPTNEEGRSDRALSIYKMSDGGKFLPQAHIAYQFPWLDEDEALVVLIMYHGPWPADHLYLRERKEGMISCLSLTSEDALRWPDSEA
jgi:hypothetical protein